MKKDLLYSATCLAFTIMIGGGVYEHLTMVPVWSTAPPVSLSMFNGEYGLNPAPFWMLIHPVNLLLFVISLVMHWRSERRKNILIVMASYVAILVITSIYFVPELLSITKTPLASTIDTELVKRAKLWELLSLGRLAVLLVLAMILFTGLTKTATVRVAQRKTKQAVAVA